MHFSLFKVPSFELENRTLSGVVQTYKGGRRKSVCWFNRNIIMEDVVYGIAVGNIWYNRGSQCPNDFFLRQ